MDLNTLAEECHQISRDHGFWEDEALMPHVHWVMSRLALIHSEVSEALEAARKDDQENFTEELVDVLIRVFDLAGGMELDLDTAMTEKMEKNRNRPYKHGKLA